MDIVEYIKLCQVKRKGLTLTDIARKMNTSPQNLSNKLSRGDLKVSDVELFADAMDADLSIQFIDRETGKPII